MKDDKTVIREFNNVVNMTVPELEKWLKSADSKQAGWSKDDGGGESIGHDSGRRIIEILKANPEKKPNQYSDEQIQHMRRVVSYWYESRSLTNLRITNAATVIDTLPKSSRVLTASR